MKNIFEKLIWYRRHGANTTLVSDWLKYILKLRYNTKNSRRLLECYGIRHLNLCDNKSGRHMR